MLSWQWMASFWSAPIVEANMVVFLNLSGALLLGLVVGDERSYHGRHAHLRHRLLGVACARH
jgi:putative Mg2+ transporter-C (MgtC) family protein